MLENADHAALEEARETIPPPVQAGRAVVSTPVPLAPPTKKIIADNTEHARLRFCQRVWGAPDDKAIDRIMLTPGIRAAIEGGATKVWLDDKTRMLIRKGKIVTVKNKDRRAPASILTEGKSTRQPLRAYKERRRWRETQREMEDAE